MAKLKNSSGRVSQTKAPTLGSHISPASSLRAAVPKSEAGRAVNVSAADSIGQALKFGTLHTKTTVSRGSSWGSLLSAATTGGGASGALSGGLLSSGAFGLIGNLLNLFGGGKSTPSAPAPFVIPASQNASVTVGGPESSSLFSVQANVTAGAHNGPIYTKSSSTTTDYAQSAQVIHIVRQALLTSSSLNDVISEI